MPMLCEIIYLFGVDGEPVRVISRLEEEPSLVCKKSMPQGPYFPVAQVFCLLELLRKFAL